MCMAMERQGSHACPRMRTRESDCGAILEKLDGDGADGMKKNSNGMEGVRSSDGGVLNHRPL